MPKSLRVLNRTRNSVLVGQGVVADTYWTRFMGLMGKRNLPEGFGLLLKNESAIHTFGMKVAIDVVYLDAQHKIIRATPAMPPTRIGPFVRGVRDVLELPVGTLVKTGTQSGDQLELEMT